MEALFGLAAASLTTAGTPKMRATALPSLPALIICQAGSQRGAICRPAAYFSHGRVCRSSGRRGRTAAAALCATATCHTYVSCLAAAAVCPTIRCCPKSTAWRKAKRAEPSK